MDDRRIKCVLSTAESGSFTKAAKDLNCTQSAMTQLINAVESELGCKLFLRTHQGVELTSAGAALLPYIKRAENSLALIKEEAAKIAGGTTRPIRIGTFSSISKCWLPPLLREYRGLHPEVHFDIRVGTNIIPEWLANAEIDIALGDDRRCGNYRWQPLMEDDYCAVLPKNMAIGENTTINQEALAQYPFLMAPMNDLKEQLSEVPKDEINVNSDDDATLLSLVEAGLGVTVMPRLSLQKTDADVQVLALSPPLKRIIGIALPETVNSAALDFVNFLKNHH